MKIFVALLSLMASHVAVAAPQYCGTVASVAYVTDIYQVIRMQISTDRGNPRFFTVHDPKAVESMISVIKSEPYQHRSDVDDFDWKAFQPGVRQKDHYFVCVTGSDIRNHSGYFFMETVQTMKVWKNGAEKKIN